MSILNPLFYAVAWVMMRIHAVLAVPFGASSGLAWGLSIVLLVVLMRLIMVPLFIKQRNSSGRCSRTCRNCRRFARSYKNDKQKLNEETMKFYKENGINPLGGCLPLVAQLPVFWSLFNVLEAIADWQPGHDSAVRPDQCRGGERPAGARSSACTCATSSSSCPPATETWATKAVILLAVLISAATTFLTMKQSQRRGMLNQAPADPDQPGAAAAAAMSKNMMYIAPFFALTGLYWQFGLVLYWVTTNLWTLGQQHFLFRNLPVVGSATVGASAVQAASGSTGAAARGGASGAAAKAGAKRRCKPERRQTPRRRARAARPRRRLAPRPAPMALLSGAAANGSEHGSGMLRRFGRGKQEPEEVEAAPQTKVVRQQPVRQTRSKRGNTGKR